MSPVVHPAARVTPHRVAGLAVLMLCGFSGLLLMRGTPAPLPAVPAADRPAPAPVEPWRHAVTPAPSMQAAPALRWVATPSVTPAVAVAPPTPLPTPDLPYRYLGDLSDGPSPTWVLYGRGRVVSVRGPMTLDDEYAVEAVFDGYLLLRHQPSGRGAFLVTGTAARPAAALFQERAAQDSPPD